MISSKQKSNFENSYENIDSLLKINKDQCKKERQCGQIYLKININTNNAIFN